MTTNGPLKQSFVTYSWIMELKRIKIPEMRDVGLIETVALKEKVE